MEARRNNRRWQARIAWLVRLALVALWAPVAADKLWNLPGFHGTLLRQPFPNWWADILFWLLPLLELLAAVLIAWPKSAKRVRQGLWLSAFLMLGFTLFILLGVLGWYAKRPCGCGSVISGLDWEQHLWFNIGFLLVSVLGVWLTRGKKHQGPSSRRSFRHQEESHGPPALYQNRPIRLFKSFFPRLCALFRRGAVAAKKRRGKTKVAFPIDYGSPACVPQAKGHASKYNT